MARRTRSTRRPRGEAPPAIDTPSLAFVAGTAPYFHDGRYASLRAMLVAEAGRMGPVPPYNDDELDALVAYLETR